MSKGTKNGRGINQHLRACAGTYAARGQYIPFGVGISTALRERPAVALGAALREAGVDRQSSAAIAKRLAERSEFDVGVVLNAWDRRDRGTLGPARLEDLPPQARTLLAGLSKGAAQ